MKTIFDQIEADTAEQIASEARALGLSLDEYLKSLLPQTNRDANEKPLYETAHA